MKVSVVIPAYNEEKYIENCLKSLKGQEEEADEIVVVDNNCTDQTVSIAEKYGARVVSERKQGMIFARNTGFNAAKYEIIARTDADTILPGDWIKRIKENFRKFEIDALTGPPIFYGVKGPKTPVFSILFFKFMKNIQGGREILAGPNMILTRLIWNKVRDRVCMEDRKVHEDIDLSLHIHGVGGKILRDNNLIVYSSARRMKKKPYSFFVEYPFRLVKNLRSHSDLIKKLH